MLYRCVLLAFVLCFLSLSQAAAQTTVAWVDAQGAPAPHYLEGGRAYVQVAYRDTWLDPGAPDSIAVDLAAQQSGDTEAFSLTETGPDTGVFAGSVQLRSAAATPWDGILQTLQSATAPYAHDTIAATLLLPEGTFTASKGLIGSLTTFLDEWGRPATQYAVRTAAYVRVEDQNRNRPGLYDFTTVTLTSAGTGDVETLALVETTKDSGVFEGSIPVRDFVQQNQDGKLDINLSDQIEVRHEDLSGPTESTDTAGIIPILLILLDEEGRPATAWFDGGMGRARVVNHALGGLDQLTVWLRSLTAGDFQQFHLPLTSPGSGIYEGTFRLATAPAVFGNGRVETASGGDTVEVEDLSSGMKLSVPVIGSRVLFLDAFGRVTDRYVPGDSIRVRVLAPSLNDPLLRDAAPVLLKQGTEQEGIQLQETGFDTGIFEGAIPSVAGTPIPGNGTLEVDFGLDVEAEFPNLNFPDPSTARARMVGAAIHFADAQGQPVERFLESSRAYVRVTYRGFGSPTSLDTLSVDLAASLTGDTEFISLTETGEDTGVFLGAIPLRLGSSTSGDGILQTAEAPGPPYELDTLTAQLYVPEGLFTATAGLTGSRTAFVDAYGREVETYPVGSRVHVRVEDQNYNRQGLWDTVQVLLRGQGNGDEEELTLQETTRDSGVYEGSIGTLGAASADRDGVFQVDGGEAIEVTHEDFLGGTESFDRAAIGFAGVFFIDEAGAPDAELLEGGIGRVRVFSQEANTGGNADSLTVTVRSRYTGDQETVTLVETGGFTSVFEGSFRLAVGPASPGNQQLETGNSGPPAFLGDEVTAQYEVYEDVAVTRGSRLLFLDALGRATEAYVPGESIRVRAINPTRNDPFLRDSAYVTLQAAGDQEEVEAWETGFDTGVFEAAVPSRAASFGNSNNGTLEATSGAEIVATHFNTNFPEPTVARARMAGGAVLFVDAQVQPATVYLEGSRAYVRVVYSHFDPGQVDSLSVDLTAALSGDAEFVSLTETSSDSGVYVGSVSLRSGSSTVGDGVLQTMQDPGPPHEYDTLTARLVVPEGAFTAAIGLTGSRTEFVDAFGRLAESFALGSKVYVRVEDQNYNRQGL